MRMLLRMSIPTESGNKAVTGGAVGPILEKVLAELKPEAAYFAPINGLRSGFIVFDLKDPSDLPRLTEPLFMGLGASIELSPVMTADDLRKGLSQIG